MSNPNIKPRLIKGDPETREIARKGGKAKKGYRSLKSVMREILASGEIDIKAYVKAQMLQAIKGNSGMARLQWEYHDGKVKDELELTGKNGAPITPPVIIVQGVEPKTETENQNTDTEQTDAAV